MYAIVEIAGQQFKVEKDQRYFVHQLEGKPGSKVSFDKVLLLDDNGKVWYVGNQMPENPSFDGEGEIWLQQLDLSEFSLIGERYLLNLIFRKDR